MKIHRWKLGYFLKHNKLSIITSLNWHAVSFYFCPRFFKNLAPNIVSIFTNLSENGYIICRIRICTSCSWKKILHKNVIINCNNPRSFSYKKYNSIYRFTILSLCQNSIFDKLRYWGNRRHNLNEIAISKIKLNWVIKWNRFVYLKNTCVWICCSPSCPEVLCILISSNIWIVFCKPSDSWWIFNAVSVH